MVFAALAWKAGGRFMWNSVLGWYIRLRQNQLKRAIIIEELVGIVTVVIQSV